MTTPRKISTALLSAAAVTALGTGVAAAAVPDAAFHAQGGTLWTANPSVNSQVAMAAGAGPSAVKTGTGAYETAFRGSNGDLATYGSDGRHNWPLTVAAGTTPGIAATSNGYVVAFNGGNQHYLWTLSYNGTSYSQTRWNVVLPADASPVVASGVSVGEQAMGKTTTPVNVVAFRTVAGQIGFADSIGDIVTSASTIAAGSNPSIVTIGSQFRVVFASGSGVLSQQSFTPSQNMLGTQTPATVSTAQSLAEPVAANTSPAVTWAAINGASDEQIAYVAPGDVVHSWSGSVDTNWNVTVSPGTSATIAFTDLTVGTFKIAYSIPVGLSLLKTTAAYELGFATRTQCATWDLKCVPSKSTQTTNLGIAAGTTPAMTIR